MFHSLLSFTHNTAFLMELKLLIAVVTFITGAALFLRSRTNGEILKKSISILLVVFSITLVASCGGDKADETDGSDTVLSTDNYTVYIQKNDIENIEDEEPDSLNIRMTHGEYAGMQLFMTHCNQCHPGGNKGTGPSLIDKPLPDFLVHFQVRQGMGDMPAFKEDQLSRDDVKKIVLFVGSMRENYKSTH